MTDYGSIYAIHADGPSRYLNRSGIRVRKFGYSSSTVRNRHYPLFLRNDEHPGTDLRENDHFEVILRASEIKELLDNDAAGVTAAIDDKLYEQIVELRDGFTWRQVLSALAWVEERNENRTDVLEMIEDRKAVAKAREEDTEATFTW